MAEHGHMRTSLVFPMWLRRLTPNPGGWSLISGLGAGCHMPQLRVFMP